jgi:transcription elongation factor GreA
LIPQEEKYMHETYLTRKGYQKLAEELDSLRNIKRRQITKAVAEARAHGDLSENAEYDAAREAQGQNEQRIAELEAKLAQVMILEDAQIPDDEVLIGAKVSLKDLDTNEELVYTLVSELEADYSLGKISINSPVGKGLMNHKVNDEVEIKIPAGTLRYKITGIQRE